jgi:hypothetical protein
MIVLPGLQHQEIFVAYEYHYLYLFVYVCSVTDDDSAASLVDEFSHVRWIGEPTV